MEVSLFTGRGMPRRVASGDDRVQDAAGALGQGADSSLQENTSQSIRKQLIAAPEDRSRVSPDGQPQLSADDRAFGLAVARHDYSLLPGMVPDALHRPALVHGFDVLHFQLLPGFAEGIVSEKLAAIAALLATLDVPRNRIDSHEYARRVGSAGRQADLLRAHSQVPGRIEER